MGVPAFFRWLANKYPLILQQVVEDSANATAHSARVRGEGGPESLEVHNLYLDTNGIVHPCCHPEGGQPQPKTEEEVSAEATSKC